LKEFEASRCEESKEDRTKVCRCDCNTLGWMMGVEATRMCTKVFKLEFIIT